MKFGIASIYPYRPHVQDLVYLSMQLEKAGHECSFLSCKSTLPTCYYNLFKGDIKSSKQCLKCRIGGFSSYVSKNKIYNIDGKRKANLNKKDVKYLINSTIGTLGRIENEFEIESIVDENTEDKLEISVNVLYQNTIDWIEKEKIEAVLVFNGRLDTTRAIILALKRNNIPFISVENHLNGLTLNYNSDCLSLDFINSINEEFRNVQLNKEQALFSGKIVGEMFLKKQKLWRNHNVSKSKSSWPNSDTKTKKVLITPSSKYEFLGNEDWNVDWTSDYTEGYSKVIEALGVNYEDCVLRCHPFWSEDLGELGKGHRSEKHYSEWGEKFGIKVISSKEDVNTLDLISEADIVLVNGGTAGIEAAILGKKVISIGKSRYYKAGFTINIFSDKDIKVLGNSNFSIKPSIIQKKVLRYLYNYHARFEQFYDLISKETALKNSYIDSIHVAKKIISFFNNESIEPYDLRRGESDDYENEIIEKINLKDWNSLIQESYGRKNKNSTYNIEKRGFLKLVDIIRDKLPAGHY